MPSEREYVAHVVRRLGMGANARLAATLETPADAIAQAFDLSGALDLPDVPPPRSYEEIEQNEERWQSLFGWWLKRMAAGDRLIEERLVWFWHDHFATSLQKVENPYLMWRQHLTLREHATGNFRDLLSALARDPALLVYLDGDGNNPEELNENFGREVMELHTLGLNQYTQEDVVAAARAFTGWMVNEPLWEDADFETESGFVSDDVEPWGALFMSEYHDHGSKTLLGHTGRLGMDEALGILLEQPAAGPHIAAKLYRELVGFWPDDATADRLGREFAADYEILPLVEAIVAEPAFLSAEAVRAKVRTPLEKLVTIMQSFAPDVPEEYLFYVLESQAYLPFNPPNPAGYPKGRRLLSPGALVGGFHLLHILEEPPEDLAKADAFTNLGLYDMTASTERIVTGASDPLQALALAFGSPEFVLT